jgi:hypothetical protein
MISGLSPKPGAKSANFGASSITGTHCPIFQTIPPERIGLNGEYDHSGLAKRVVVALKEFEPEELSHLKVTQRGKVVIFMGKLSSQQVLKRMVHIAMQVDGAADVETNGVTIIDSIKRLPSDRSLFDCPYCAC